VTDPSGDPAARDQTGDSGSRNLRRSPARRFLKYGVTALVALLAALTVLAFFDRWSPYLELLTVFRLQYAVLLGVTASFSILLRGYGLALAAIALAAVNIIVISRVALAGEGASIDGARVRALIVNVQAGNTAYDQLRRLIAETEPDLVGIIELTPAWTNALESALSSYPHRSLQPDDGAYGIGLYSKLPLRVSRIEHFPAGGSPSVIATVPLGDSDIVFIVTHIHTPFSGGTRSRQLEALTDALQPLNAPRVICGDFNSVPWSQPIDQLADQNDLRSIHGRFGLPGTWPANAWPLRIPIDNCLLDHDIRVEDSRVGPSIGSDHLPLIVDLAPMAP
jgi:endonuclease/exonuclease/phosphatase (EEP) superfamily protein YafD